MPGNDENDPLDRWLTREVQPLPPPPGTFELIHRRARRRKLRALAVTVTSAAAVVAAISFALPNVTSLRLTQPATTGAPAAARQEPTATPAKRPARNALTQSATPDPTAPPAAAGPPPGGPLPGNFRPTSVTFIGPGAGWAIGQGGPPCATQFCTSVVRTQDGGRTWQGAPAPKTSNVAALRFLNRSDGWAYGPALWSTHDGGGTWGAVDTGGQQVTDLETAGRQAFAIFANCAVGSSGCGYTLKTTQAGTDNWADVGPATTGLQQPSAASAGKGAGPSIVLTGSTGWLLAADGTLYSGPLSGRWASIGPVPCAAANSAATGALLTWDAFTSTLIAACTATPAQPGAPAKQGIYTSTDMGRSWHSAATAPAAGAVTSLATAPGALAILATTGGIEIQQPGDTQDRQVATLAGGFSYVGMTTDQQGVALPANTSLHQIWMTRDGGQTWQPALTGP
jgi:hypothetical protein